MASNPDLDPIHFQPRSVMTSFALLQHHIKIAIATAFRMREVENISSTPLREKEKYFLRPLRET